MRLGGRGRTEQNHDSKKTKPHDLGEGHEKVLQKMTSLPPKVRNRLQEKKRRPSFGKVQPVGLLVSFARQAKRRVGEMMSCALVWKRVLVSTVLLLLSCCATALSRRSTTAGIYGRVVPIPAGTRAHYNLQNFAGPGTYKFGYDTGSGPNQSFRQEERGADGKVEGRYGYVEPSGALRVVEYTADAQGFHILKTRTLVPDMKPKAAVKVRTPFVGPLPPFIPTSYVVNLAG